VAKDQNEEELLRAVALENAKSILLARQKAEEALRESEARFRHIADHAPFMVWVTEPDGTCSFLSQSWYDFTGQTPQTGLDCGWLAAVHPDDKKQAQKTFVAANEKHEPFRLEYRLRGKNGEYRWAIDAASPRFDAKDNFLGFIGSVIDITERKEAENAKARLAAIVESSDDAIISKDLNGIINSWNRGAERLYGYTAEEVIGQPITILIPAERLDEEPRILERIRRGERIEHYETVRRRKDGGLLNISLTVSPIVDGSGQIVGASKIARDITERKRTERELQKLTEELESRVAERTAELHQVNALLLRDIEEKQKLHQQLLQAQKMESIGILAGGIAHDFNNILNIIQGYAFILRGRGVQTKEVSESLGVIDETIQRGAALVQQLLTLARKTEIKIDSVDANRLIEGLIALIKQTFPKTIELSADLATDLPSIMVDGNQLGQALLNLAVNARDAMPQGGNLIFRTTSVDSASLRKLGEASAARYVCIEVADNGLGMDKKVQQRIFEPFFTTKEIGHGTGLGLSVVYAIIKNHNGFVDLESKPKSGTTFRLYLPTGQSLDKPAEELAGVAALETTEQSNGRGTILVVEDENNMLHLLEKVLLKHGYQVLLASDGQMALDIYKRRKAEIDAVLLDIGLPKRAGRDVLFKMKEENPAIKVVVTSGYLDPGLKSYIKEAGIHHFISKPYGPADVVQTLQSLMEGKRSA
jgi:PAS domain S-box-containing protein